MTDEPPRRYSIGQEDFSAELAGRLLIRLDDAEQKSVIEYDCDAGTLLRYKLDEEGRVQLTPTKDEAERESMHGDVTVEWRD